MPDLGSTISLNASNFAAGVAQTRAKLVELNTALIENRNKMKEVNKEAQELQKQEKALTDAMKDGGTKEQQQELEQLRTRIGQVNSELGTLRTREQEIQSDIRKTSNELKEQKNDTNNLTTATDGATAAIKKLETGLKAVLASAAGKKLYEVLIGSNAEMEQYLTSFEVMLGDARKAKDLMSELNTMAAKTPMELTDVVKNGTLLMNYGVDSDKLIETMTKLGDLAAGNAQKFERVSLAYGQMLAKGKVSGEELRQMTEAGVPLLQALAEEIGVTSGEMQDLVSKGKIGIPELNAAIESMTTGTGQFAGMMEKQSQTFSGMLSTLSDEAQQFGREVGEDAFGVAKESLSELLDMIDDWRDDGTLDSIAKDLGTTVGAVAGMLKSLITLLVNCRGAVIPLVAAFLSYQAAVKGLSVIDGVKASVAALTTMLHGETIATEGATIAQEGLNVAMSANPIGLVIAAVAGLSAGLIYLYSQVENAEQRFNRLNGEISELHDSTKKASEEQGKLAGVVEEYKNIIDNVTDVHDKKEKLIELQKTLNDLYGEEKTQIDLVNGSYEENIRLLEAENEAARQRAINQIQSDLEQAEKKQSEATTLQAISIDFDASKITKEVNDWYKEIQDKISDDGFNLVELTGFGDDSTLTFSGNIDQVIENLDNLEKAILSSGKASTDLKDMFDAVHDGKERFVEMKNATEDIREELVAVETGTNAVSDAENALGDSAAKASVDLEALAAAIEETDKNPDVIKERSDAVNDLVKNYGSLYDTMKELQNGDAISYEKMQALVKIYPELANHIIVTADGYKIETGALGDLNTALGDSVLSQVEAEKAKTQAAIKGSKDRIALYIKEMETYARSGEYSKANQIKQAADAERATIAELEGSLSTYDTLPKYLTGNRGTKAASSGNSGASGNNKAASPPGLKSIMSYAKTASSAFKEMQDNGELALSTVQALIDAGYDEKVVYQDAAGKWIINTDEYLKAANAQINAARDAEGTTEIQKNALEALRGELSKVTEGLYETAKAEKALKSAAVSAGDTAGNMKTLSAAIVEQKDNKGLSADTVSKLSGTRYAEALTVGVDAQITLDTDKLKTILSDEIEDAIKQLETELATATDESKIKGLEAQIQAFRNLKAVIGDVTEGLYGVEKAQEKIVSDEALKATEDAANRRLKQIDAELKAKQKLRDETLKAIDDEVQARKRLTEDNDIQRQIDQTTAKLKYSQLDEFSRRQLERRLQQLQNEQAELAWERGIEDTRSAVNESYNSETAVLNEQKDAIENSLSVLKELNSSVNDGISSLVAVVKDAVENVAPDREINVTFNNADSLSSDQIVRRILDYFGVDTVI